MILKSLTFLILAFTWQLSVAQEACIEKSVVPLQIETIKDLIQVKTKLWPSVSTDFCYGRRSCNYFTEYNEPPKPKPAEFFCEEDSLYESISAEDASQGLCQLTTEERLVIQDYSDDYFSCMNTYLRQDKIKSPEIDYYIQTLNKALDKLPSYQGVVIRGADLPPEIAKLHTKGQVVNYAAFTSTSTSQVPWGKDRFIIISKTGKPIMNLSGIKEEYEVLFKSHTRFKVLDVFKEGEVTYYVMKEVGAQPDSPQELNKDLNLIKKLKADKGGPRSFDEWSCVKGQAAPKTIKQKAFPLYNKDPDEDDEDEIPVGLEALDLISVPQDKVSSFEVLSGGKTLSCSFTKEVPKCEGTKTFPADAILKTYVHNFGETPMTCVVDGFEEICVGPTKTILSK